MAFSEKIKLEVKKKAHFRCCRCQAIGVEIHHILPRANGGDDSIGNAAPLCSNCHSNFGGNPDKQKEIRQMRDWWFEECQSQSKPVFIANHELPGRLNIKFKSNPINSGFIGDGSFSGRPRWIFEFDIINSTKNSYYLENWDIDIIQFDEELLDLKDFKNLVITEQGYSDQSVRTPYEIEANSRILLYGMIHVKLVQNSPEFAAQKISNIKSFKTSFNLLFIDLHRTEIRKEYSFVDDFDYFRKYALKHWEKNNFNHLLSISNQTKIV